MIRDMISSKSLSASQMAKAAGCSKRSIITISTNLRIFGDVRAPPIPGGRPRMITPIMLEALCNHLLEKPDLYLDEMAEFLYDEFDVLVSTYTVSRAL
jgi:transposase